MDNQTPNPQSSGASSDQDTANEQATSSEASAPGDQYTNNRNVSSGSGGINDYGGVAGDVYNIYYPGNPPNNSPNRPASESATHTGIAQPTMNTFSLNQKIKNNVTQSTISQICDYINSSASYPVDLSYPDLEGTGPNAKSLNLIDQSRRRRVLTLLIEGINIVQPELLGADYEDWRAWAVEQDAKRLPALLGAGV
jgi:hypothetical protein